MVHFYQTLLALVGAMAAIAACLLLSIVIRCRLALRAYKRKIKDLPLFDDIRLVGNNLFGMGQARQICRVVDEAHKRLGKTFGWIQMYRYGACTTDLDLIKLIVVDEGEIHTNRCQTDLPLQEVENSILLAEDEQWRKLRRIFAPAFKSNKFKTPNVMEDIDGSIQMLIDHIESKLDAHSDQSKLFEADDLTHKFSLQLIFSCLYKQYNLIDFNDEHCYWVKTIDEGHELVLSSWVPKLALFFPSLNPFIDWLVYNFHAQGAWRRSIFNFIRMQAKLTLEARKELNMKKNKGADKNNFRMSDGAQFKRNMVDYITDYYLDGKLTKEEFFNSSFLMLGAADKTTTDALIHTLYLLATNPEQQELAREAVKWEGFESEYLAWVINESLRLLPPVPAGCSRTIKRDIEVEGGGTLPAGSFVAVSTFTIHRMPEYWGEDAEEFRPERWQDTSKHHPLQFVPFGHGIRSCIGRQFALFEMKKVLSALLSRYKLDAKRKSDAYDFDAVYLTFIIPASKTYISFKRLDREAH